jgi:hypothetical protein
VIRRTADAEAFEVAIRAEPRFVAALTAGRTDLLLIPEGHSHCDPLTCEFTASDLAAWHWQAFDLRKSVTGWSPGEERTCEADLPVVSLTCGY